MPDVKVHLGPQSYTVHVGAGLLDRLGARCQKAGFPRRVALISSRPVGRRFGPAAQRALRTAGFRVHTITVPDGEAVKTPDQVARVYEALAKARFERGEAVIALGGGSVGDAAGFVAATYLRGVPFVQVPTTLLAQVDSSVGGKTGINLRQGKNLAGAFWQPRFVICDTELLTTLPRRQMAAGLAEVVKYACIARPGLLGRIESSLSEMLGPGRQVDPALVAACVRIKAAVVRADEREADLRRILNFGHTYGHALERAVKHPPLLHGEAVALGMAVALELSVRTYPQSPDAVRNVYGLLRTIFPRLDFPGVPWRRVSPYLARDKKVSGRAPVWVLLRKLGQPVMTELRAARTIQAAVAAAAARWHGR